MSNSQDVLIADLAELAREHRSLADTTTHRLVVCAGSGCIASGALAVHDALVAACRAAGLDVVVSLRREDEHAHRDGAVHVSGSGCQGFCQMGPLVAVEPDGTLYVKVTPGDAGEIVASLRDGTAVERLLYREPRHGQICRRRAEIPFYELQTRRVLAECGRIDPEDVREYIAHGGYAAAWSVWHETGPDEVCARIEAAGLRGRGGGGFPTGRKWRLTLDQPGDHKCVICNGDEGDPGAFMDRSVMEGNPHSVVEGMLIAAHAVGADRGVVYVRAEYPLAVRRMRRAARDAHELGLLGDDVMGTGRPFRLEVMEGAGAFVCGEETALMASIEGHRGMPRPKPPFPSERGLHGLPTVINNVETLAAVPLIVRDGVEEFRRLGTAGSPGTKTFALTGHVANTGLIEVPFGTTLREIVETIGGGVIDDDGRPDADGFKAVQIGGPSGGCLTAEHLDLPLDFDSLGEVGAMVGSGGLVVMNRTTCMVQVARFFMQFTQNESCGKCVLCREGTRQMLGLLDRVIAGEADAATLPLLQRTARAVATASLCGLGKTAPSPVLSTLHHFGDEYAAHVDERRCPAGRCKALAVPEIVAELCRGCTICARKCPVGAITGDKKQPHVIDPDACTRCGVCAEVCKFEAVVGL
ncbi:4Fe-4S dicluster domain-containing protein [bacterium]|nr:4Fe-4S dicluster domain-containing protein [bacterium]